MKKSATTKGESPSRLIDARIKELDDWRGETLSHVRALIKQADPEVVEEWKWRGVPVWSHDGLICTGETYKSVVKLTFAKGASLKDPSGLFNSSLDGNTRRTSRTDTSRTRRAAILSTRRTLQLSCPCGTWSGSDASARPAGGTVRYRSRPLCLR